MNRIKKVSRPVTCLLALLLCVMLLASTAFAAGGALVKQPVPKMEIPNILKELETGGCA